MEGNEDIFSYLERLDRRTLKQRITELCNEYTEGRTVEFLNNSDRCVLAENFLIKGT